MVALALVLAPSSASALTVGTSTLTLEVGAQVFARARGRAADGGAYAWDMSLTRARLKLSMRYGAWLRADIEPDFGGADVDLADVFLELAPVEPLAVRVGQHKVPFGTLESMGRFGMPSLTRGLVSDIVADRLGFGGRKFGAKAEWRQRDLPLKPGLELGAYGEQGATIGDDVALRLGVRALKGLDAELAGVSKDAALTDAGRGHVGALSAVYDKKGALGVVELMAGRTRLLSASGVTTGVDATFLAARLLAAYRFGLGDLGLEPFFGADLFEPNLATADDLGLGLRGGVNLVWLERLRVGAEADRQMGQVGAVSANRSSFTFFLGVNLE